MNYPNHKVWLNICFEEVLGRRIYKLSRNRINDKSVLNKNVHLLNHLITW
jgi:hypothetical protein